MVINLVASIYIVWRMPLRANAHIKPKQAKPHIPLAANTDGFLEIPYIVNSPQSMMERLSRLPFAKYNSVRQCISAKTPFLDIVTFHRNVKDELFVVYSEAYFTANICFKSQLDKSVQGKYYCLSLRIDQFAKKINSLANGIAYSDNSWLIFKPEARVDHHHFHGTRGRYLSLYFTKEWLENYLFQLGRKQSKELLSFIHSDRDYLICQHAEGNLLFNIEKLAQLVTKEDPASKNYSTRMRKAALNFILFFVQKLQADGVNEKHFLLSNLDRMRVLQVLEIMKGHIYVKFPGISYLAREAGLSETKLKECFRYLYNTTPLQYFISLQMKKAQECLGSGDYSIAQVARKFSYANRSKFSAAFKKKCGILPSQVR
ncbi:MAG TPA: AraC family transcriptional regulator [Chryseosolibacter sp.]|nr:AraC family transcriptional regulator [Chryseosolibacter sp.]